MKKNIAICALTLLVVYLCAVIIRVENQRYALYVGLCHDDKTHIQEPECLKKVQTRTSSFWHLYYAITD